MTDWTQTVNTEENSEQIFKSIKSDYQKIKTIIEKIEWYYSNFENFTNGINQKKDELEANHSISNELKSKIDEFKKTSENNIQTIKGFLDQASWNTKELEGIINNAKDLNKSFNETTPLIWQNLEESKKMLIVISALKQTSDSKVLEIQKTLDNIKEKILDIENFYKNFEELGEKIINEESWAQALLDYINEQKKESEVILKELWDMRLKANTVIWEIEQEKQSSIRMSSEINVLLQKSEEDKEEISKYVKIITNTGFANTFDKKGKNFQFRSIIWTILFFLSTIGLFVFLVRLFKDFIKEPEKLKDLTGTLVAYRITFTTPILFLIAFIGREQASAKRNSERYWFKSAISQAFPSHIQQLIDKFWTMKNGEEIILEIVKNTYSTIYRTPYTEDHQSKFEEELLSKAKVEILKDKGSKKTENLIPFISEIKSLKETIPDTKELIEIVKIIMNK